MIRSRSSVRAVAAERAEPLANRDHESSIQPSVCVIIPTLNEERNIRQVLLALPKVAEVILVDGNSIDDTVGAARSVRPDVRVVAQTRRGKGNALVCGFAAATADIVVAIDADGSTNPDDIPRFVETLCSGADFATGTRFVNGAGSADITKVRRLGSDFLTGIANLLFRTKYTDINFGYNAFWRRHLAALGLPDPTLVDKSAKLMGDGFEIESLLNVRAAKAGLSVVEVPAYEECRGFGDSNLHSVRDGLRILRAIVTSRFVRLRPLQQTFVESQRAPVQLDLTTAHTSSDGVGRPRGRRRARADAA